MYSYYRDLKGLKHKEERPCTTDSPSRPVITVIQPHSSASPTAPFTPPSTQDENVYMNVRTNNAANNVGSATTSARQSEQFYNYYTLPDRLPDI